MYLYAVEDLPPVENLPPNPPLPRQNSVEVNCFVDSDHAEDNVMLISQTGILLYLNSAPIIWYSKRQNKFESSTFSSEFVALRLASELFFSLRTKLQIFFIPLLVPSTIFCDNETVYKNVCFDKYILQKKHNSIYFHSDR